MKNFTPRRQLPKLLLPNFLVKFPTELKIINLQVKMTLQQSLLLEQESYLSLKKTAIKKILQTTDPYTVILKNRLRKNIRYNNR